jgi:hypothetical protein
MPARFPAVPIVLMIQVILTNDAYFKFADKRTFSPELSLSTIAR